MHIRPVGGGADLAVIDDAREPSLSGNHVAVVDGGGVTVWDWQADTPVDSITGVSHPALAWPLLAYVRVDSGSRVIVVRNLENAETEQVRARVKRSVDLGRPSLRGGRLAWHTASRRSSSIVVKTLSSNSPARRRPQPDLAARQPVAQRVAHRLGRAALRQLVPQARLGPEQGGSDARAAPRPWAYLLDDHHGRRLGLRDALAAEDRRRERPANPLLAAFSPASPPVEGLQSSGPVV